MAGELNLELPAKSLWTESGNEIGGSSRDHETLREAILFVMEELDARFRNTAMIQSGNHGFLIAEVTKLYQQIADPETHRPSNF